MQRILTQDILKQYLERYGEGQFDLNDQRTKDFLEVMAGKMLLLVPEASVELERKGLEDSPEAPYIAMASIAAAIQYYAEGRLNKLRENRRSH